MIDYYNIIRPLIFLLEPELAHNVALWCLSKNILPSQPKFADTRLSQNIFGMNFDNPVGLAAGFDKNAIAINGLINQRFSFIEVGTVTLKPQDGNDKPRLFRLSDDKAIINRMGFNNNGADELEKNIIKYKQAHGDNAIIGINIGKNKDSNDANYDYESLFNQFHSHASYIAINISSPNTAGLRDLQNKEHLETLLSVLANAKKANEFKTPILVKIAPDITWDDLDDIIELSLKYKIDGLILTNTTIFRNNLRSNHAAENGGLSGAPLKLRSNQVLARAYKILDGKIPLIGVGGIMNAHDAYEKICYGASLIQLYSGLIYQGFGLVNDINRHLIEMLQQNGYKNIAEAVGSKTNEINLS
jgi:dihydroorotate dehydrogenase